jgi:CubicO group peptidase (beta-lactamase class C family)
MNHVNLTAFRLRMIAVNCLIMLVITCAGPCAIAQVQTRPALSEQTQAKITAQIESYVKDKGIPGLSIAIAMDNELVFEKGFGLADVENDVAATANTRYRTASIAKSLTAVVILSLVNDKKIDLDQEIQTYCVDYPKKKWPVTVRQVMGHLGGVRHYKSGDEALSTKHFFTLKSALATFADDPLLNEPGTQYRYSSFGYNLLGSVAECAGEKDFFSLVDERIIQPAKMQHTVVDDTLAIVKNRSRGYFRPNRAVLFRLPRDHTLVAGELYNAPLHDTSSKIPGGGLLSTAPDLVRFACAVNTGKLLPEQLVEEMWTEQKTTSGKTTGYGLGWGVGNQFDRRRVSHTGGQSGTSTVLTLFPDSGVSVAIMCNQQDTPLTALASDIAGELFESQD